MRDNVLGGRMGEIVKGEEIWVGQSVINDSDVIKILRANASIFLAFNFLLFLSFYSFVTGTQL